MVAAGALGQCSLQPLSSDVFLLVPKVTLIVRASNPESKSTPGSLGISADHQSTFLVVVHLHAEEVLQELRSFFLCLILSAPKAMIKDQLPFCTACN